MKIFSKILNSGISETISAAGGVVDKLTTSDQERMQAKEELTGIVTEFAKSITESQAEVLKAEISGNWLQRSWRPIIMLAFGFIVIYRYFVAPTFGMPMAELPENFWNLLEIGMGGYVIGRSVEKITESIATNMDKIPGKKQK